MSRKGALLMLMAAVLWAAPPAFACLLTAPGGGLSSCCRGTMRDCPMRGMGQTTTCCQQRTENAAIASEAPPAPAPAAVFFPRQASLLLSQSFVSTRRLALEAPPPDPSPGGRSNLRI
jgi:hypothetical protein